MQSPLTLPTKNSQKTPKYCPTPVLKAFQTSQLIKYPNLSKLYFNPNDQKDLEPQAFTKLCQGLKTLKSLTVLHLNLSNAQELNDNSMKELAISFRKLSNLTTLSLNFRRNPNITGKGIATLLQSIQKNRYLDKLYLDFDGCGYVSEQYLTSIYTSISNLRLLTSFNLFLFGAPFDFHNDVPRNHLQRLRKLKYMRDFSMNLDNSNPIRSTDVQALSQSLSRMLRLSKVTLNLGSLFYLDEEALGSLVNCVKNLKKLRKLNISFVTCRISKSVLDNLSKVFQKPSALSDLSIDFSSRDKLTSSDLQNLLLSLQNLTNLSKLDLNFNSCRALDNHALQLLSEGIFNLKGLTSLKLGFFKCFFMNGQSLISLSKILENLTSLRVFEFTAMEKNLRDGLPRFFKALSSQTSLDRLSLRFFECKEFQDQDLEILAETLSKFKHLEYLDLNFRFCTQITDQSTKDLALVILGLQELKTLRLNFFGCDLISEEGVALFSSNLSQLKSLKTTHFNFPYSKESNSLQEDLLLFSSVLQGDVDFDAFPSCIPMHSGVSDIQQSSSLEQDLPMYSSVFQGVAPMFAHSTESSSGRREMRQQPTKSKEKSTCSLM